MRTAARLCGAIATVGIAVFSAVSGAADAFADCPSSVSPSVFACTGPHQVTVTSGVEHDEVIVNSEGDKIVFVESAPGGSALYTARVFDVPNRFRVTLQTLAAGLYAHPMLDGFGGMLLFQSNANLPGANNADGSPETYLMNLGTRSSQQLTNYPNVLPPLPGPNPTGRASYGSVSEDGALVVFASTADTLVPGHNNDRNSEIFLCDTRITSPSCYQLTETAGVPGELTNLHPVMLPFFDPFGTAVSFVSTASMDPGFSDSPDGNHEVYTLFVQERADCDGVSPPPECDPGTNFPPRFEPPLPTALAIDEGQPLRVNPPPQPAGLRVVGVDDDADDIGLSAIVDNWTALRLSSNSYSAIGAQFDTCPPGDQNCLGDQALLTWTPSFAQGGKDYQIKFTVSDGIDDVSHITTITVRNVNRPPTVGGLSDRVIKYGYTYTFGVSGSDPDREEAWDTSFTPARRLPDTGDPLTLSGSLPGFCTLSPPAASVGSIRGTLTCTPQPSDANADGSGRAHQVTVTVADGRGEQASMSKTLTVVRNQLPRIDTRSGQVAEFTTLALPIRGSDPDPGDVVAISVDPADLPADSVFLSGTDVFYWHPRDPNMATPTTPAVFRVRFCVSDGTDVVCQCAHDREDDLSCQPKVKITVTHTDERLAILSTSISTTLVVAPGATVPVTFTSRNTGQTTWTTADGFALSSQYVTAGMTVPDQVPLLSAVPPGAAASFTMNAQVPTKPGWYWLRTQMVQGEDEFGSVSPWVALQVQ